MLPGKLVGLNKWECANQIGSIALHHSWDGKPSLLVAQPGGTFMRIRCVNEENVLQDSTGSSEQTRYLFNFILSVNSHTYKLQGQLYCDSQELINSLYLW